jgi:O-antigen ligase
MSTVTITAGAPPRDRFEFLGLLCLLGFVGTLQVSIFAAGILLTAMLLFWVLSSLARDEAIEAPRMFAPLVVYGALTLLSAAFSSDPRASFTDSKQLVLFLIVPAVYSLARGDRAFTVANVIVTVGALSAAIGIVQYGVLRYDHLGQRPQGTLGHYMTYSGLLMLVISAATARLLFERRDRVWPALVMPALLVAVSVTFTRSAWIGACVGVGLLFSLKDRRLLAIVPITAAVFIAAAPSNLTERFYSMFNRNDPTTVDRVAMLKAGVGMIRADPLTGVGPEMVGPSYAQYREASAVQKDQPHLHNVFVHIGAERGLPALAAWCWFVGTLIVDLRRKLRLGERRFLPATGLAVVGAMLTAGMFEYNFGDSEFLMLFLVLVTLPFAADRGGSLP